MYCFVVSRQFLFRIALVRIVRRLAIDCKMFFEIGVMFRFALSFAVGDRVSVCDRSVAFADGVGLADAGVVTVDRGSILDRVDSAGGVVCICALMGFDELARSLAVTLVVCDSIDAHDAWGDSDLFDS